MTDSNQGQVLFTLGTYQVLKLIGKGGGGEVFLAYDTVGKKNVALKRLQKDGPITALQREQFLKEVQFTNRLTHPSIIPIYSIFSEGDDLYYTMPYIEGTTLSEVLSSPPLGSISKLCYIFLQICQAVAYAHSKGFIHRDLKPSNIMIGPYGVVVILDWGLVALADEKRERDGKVSGSVEYIAPELIFGEPPSYQTEVYSLGMILYQMLTLRSPFHRTNITEYAENLRKEALVAPEKVAPFRNIPPVLSRMALKCLAESPGDRYKTVEDLLSDLETYLEGSPKWIEIAKLDLNRSTDWDLTESGVRLSKDLFFRELKVEANVHLNEGKLGFILQASEAPPKKKDARWLTLEKDVWHKIRIETREDSIFVYLNDRLQDVFVDFFPKLGTRLALLFEEGAAIDSIRVFMSGTAFKADHLAAGNALLSHHLYTEAMLEYRRVGNAFKGTHEGRKGLFLAGIALLELAKEKKNKKTYNEAFLEFENLQGTDAGALMFLGKALIFQAQKKWEEEADSYEAAFHRTPHHPYLKWLQWALMSRLTEWKKWPREQALRFFYLAARYLSSEETSVEAEKALAEFKEQLEPLFFYPQSQRWSLAIHLAFLMGRHEAIIKIMDDALKAVPATLTLIQDALFALLELGEFEKVQEKLDVLSQRHLDAQAVLKLEWIQQALLVHRQGFSQLDEDLFKNLPKSLESENMEPIWHILQEALQQEKTKEIHRWVKKLMSHTLSDEQIILLDCYEIWAYLLENDSGASLKLLERYPKEYYTTHANTLAFLYGCWIAENKGKKAAIKHFSQLSPMSYFWKNFIKQIKLKETASDDLKLSPWEKRRFMRRLTLFYHCVA